MISKQTAKLIACIAENLPNNLDHSVIQWWIENPTSIQRCLSGLLSPNRFLPTWKTIMLGTYKDVTSLKQAMLDMRFYIYHRSYEILDKCATMLASKETPINLVTATVQELGFNGDACYYAICARIKELGYNLCLFLVLRCPKLLPRMILLFYVQRVRVCTFDSGVKVKL